MHIALLHVHVYAEVTLAVMALFIIVMGFRMPCIDLSCLVYDLQN